MNTRSKYRTKQRELLLEYLKSRPGIHTTASDIYEYFKKQDAPIGQSTIYRQLESLVAEGLIHKYIIDAGCPACFEYAALDKTESSSGCFHCKCEKCGKLIHLYCEQLDGFQTHLLEDHRFRLDPTRTVFYGLCDQCAGKEKADG